MARPVIESGHYHASIGYLDLPNNDQATLQYIVNHVTTAINVLSDWAAGRNIR
mgnify:FL=1